MDHVRRQIAARSLSEGARLPSIRQMAATLGVSKSTVVEAYDRLVAGGVIVARAGSGFTVGRRLVPLAVAAPASSSHRSIDPVWIARQALDAAPGMLMPGCGWLPADWMPVDAIRKALRAAARAPDRLLTDYARPLGHVALRHLIAARLAERQIAAAPDQILLTDSAIAALDLICRFFLKPGDTVLVDDPCYFNFRACLKAHGARVTGVPFLKDGPDLAALEEILAREKPRLYVTTAVLHNPTGASLSGPAIHRMLKLAEAHDLIIVEDDVFADFDVEPRPRLAAYDGLDRVIHIGSFSKTLSAALRVGHIAARPDWIAGLTDLKLATSFASNDLVADSVHRLLTDGAHRRHVETLRRRLADAMARTLPRLEALGLKAWTRPRAGPFLWMELPEGMSSEAMARAAVSQGVVLAPGNVFSVSGTSDQFLRFNVAQCGEEKVFEVVGRGMT